MLKMRSIKLVPPLSEQTIRYVLVVTIILLALLAGFYHSAYTTEKQKSIYLQQQLRQE